VLVGELVVKLDVVEGIFERKQKDSRIWIKKRGTELKRKASGTDCRGGVNGKRSYAQSGVVGVRRARKF